ncbi:MAG: hypothetical protein D3M94_12725 [Rhodocyclales bacterium GT-UBC]|nr:MAG: hypothetical protein D3M94_12725 [Rhodocyclales bacterium GT-UBC]
MKPVRLIIRGITGLALVLPAAWLAWSGKPLPLLLLLTIAAALVAIRVGQEGEARYGRRVPITEMLALGRQGDRRMLLGGIAGYLMAGGMLLALFLAF